MNLKSKGSGSQPERVNYVEYFFAARMTWKDTVESQNIVTKLFIRSLLTAKSQFHHLFLFSNFWIARFFSKLCVWRFKHRKIAFCCRYYPFSYLQNAQAHLGISLRMLFTYLSIGRE